MKLLRTAFAVVAAGALQGSVARGEGLDSFLKKISSSDGNVRRAAWESAADQGAAAIRPLAHIAAGEDRDAALAAARAMDRIAHAAAAPGAQGRKEVTAALVALLRDSTLPVARKLHTLELLGLVGEDDAVPAVAAALSDAELCDFARKALERIPGEASINALESALSLASGEFQRALILTLGKKQAKSAIGALTRIAEEEGPSRVAAGRALARIGDPSGIPVIQRVIKGASPRERAQVTDDYLQMADALGAAGKKEAARQIFLDVWAQRDGGESQRYAALHALYRERAQDPEALIQGLDDLSPRIRCLAIELLVKSEGDRVDKLILDRLGSSKGSQKAILLRLVAERHAPEAERRIAEALEDQDIDVKVTALDLSGKLLDPLSEAVLVSALERGSADVREVASRAVLDLADRKVVQEPKAAGKMYARVLEASSDSALAGRAVLGIAQTADPEYLPRIEAARKEARLSRSANQAYVAFAKALGRGGKKDEAVAMLLSVLSSGPSRETVQSAVQALKELGADPTIYQKKLGFIASWWLVGPFPNREGKGFDQVFSPEEEINLEAQKDAQGRSRKWQAYSVTSREGILDLRQAFQRTSEVCAYAYCELEAPETQDVRFKIGSDDGVVCWLNGKKIHSNNTTRPCQVDQDTVDTRLEKGKNKILLKITQGGGEWEFCLRITDRKDKPLDLTAIGKEVRF